MTQMDIIMNKKTSKKTTKKTVKKAPKKAPKKSSKASEEPKISEMEQTHGKDENFEPSTLDQIWGDDGMSKYDTMDEKVYLKQLDEMGRTDLESHATMLGIVPTMDRERLEARLLDEFRRHIYGYTSPKPKGKPSNNIENLPSHIRRILEEGR
jgi:hypothetical protein